MIWRQVVKNLSERWFEYKLKFLSKKRKWFKKFVHKFLFESKKFINKVYWINTFLVEKLKIHYKKWFERTKLSSWLPRCRGQILCTLSVSPLRGHTSFSFSTFFWIYSRNEISHKIDFKAVKQRSGHADSVEVKNFCHLTLLVVFL